MSVGGDSKQRCWKLFSLLCILVAWPCSGQLVSGTAPDMPLRGIGINEGLADLPGYSLGQATTTTAADIAAHGYHVVKIWPKFQWPAALSPIFEDPRIQVIIYRPLHLSQTTTACGLTAYVWENVDYGQIARRLYQLYGHHEKIVILTGWEADNQIDFLPVENPTCSWPAQNYVDDYLEMLDTRQLGVRQARESNVAAKLRIYHAVEVRQVPSAPSGNQNVLEQIVPRMAEPPDFISFSAWGTPPSSLTAKLNTIATVSGLPRHRIFIGEWGCRTDNANRAACFRDHANSSFNWGVRLWNVWSYSESGTSSGYDLINGKTGVETSNGFSVIGPLNATWYRSGNDFFTVTPCRVADTRLSGGPLTSSASRTFQISGLCGIPATADAVAMNVTLAEVTQQVSVQAYPSTMPPPGTNVVSASPARPAQAGFAILRLGDQGAVDVTATFTSPGQAHVILDVTGFFDF